MVAGPAQGLGLKRLGTVLRSRNRHSIFHRSSSPDTRLSEKHRVPGLPHLGSPKHSNLSDGGSLTLPSSSHSMREEPEMSPPPSQNGTGAPISTIASSIPPSSAGSNQAPTGLPINLEVCNLRQGTSQCMEINTVCRPPKPMPKASQYQRTMIRCKISWEKMAPSESKCLKQLIRDVELTTLQGTPASVQG